MFIGPADAGFVLALPFHHGVLEPDSRSFDEVCGIKIPLQDFALKMQGGLMLKWGRICGTLQYKLSLTQA